MNTKALSELRVVLSPLWEVFSSLSLLSWEAPKPWPYSDWSRAAERSLQRRPGRQLVIWMRELRGVVPSALTLIPSIERPIDEELRELVENLTCLPDTQLATLMASSGSAAPRSREGWLLWFCAAVNDYWRTVFEPQWESMHAALREDILVKAKRLASEGVNNAMSHFDRRIQWTPPVLRLPAAAPSRHLRCDDRLILVPQLFGRRATRCVIDESGTVAVSYQARGTAVLGASSVAVAQKPLDAADSDRLGLLLGRGKASVLRALASPATTSELASSLGLSPSTISQHLSTLVAADIARKHRSGARVIYVLQSSGIALLRYLDGRA